jgi:hypothetical protein
LSLVEMVLRKVICEIAKLLDTHYINSNIKDMQFLANIELNIGPYSFCCMLHFAFPFVNVYNSQLINSGCQMRFSTAILTM